MSGHFIMKCKVCGKTIVQCRCMDCNKEVRYSICNDCFRKESPDVTNSNGKELPEATNLNEILNKKEPSNTKIYIVDDKHHNYKICDNQDKEILNVKFQKGPVKEYGVNGVSNVDLLEIVKHQLECFQQSEFKTRENAIAITKIEESILWLNERTSKSNDHEDLSTEYISLYKYKAFD